MIDRNDEVFVAFIEESREHLSTLEEDILGLEAEGEVVNDELVNKVLPRLPTSLPVPVVVVQHMPPLFTGHLAEGLASKCALKIDRIAERIVQLAG